MILHLINHAGRGGTEKYVLTLARHQLAQGHSVILAYNEDGPLVEWAGEAGARASRVVMRHPLDLTAARRVAKLCREGGAEVIHTHMPRENCVALLSRLFYRRVKVINTCHLVMEQGKLWRIINKIFSRHNAAVITVCNAQRETLVKNGVDGRRIKLIPNGIPLAPDDPLRQDKRAAVRREFGIDAVAVMIVTLTRYESIKGVDFLIDAAVLLQKKLPDARILIAGGGDEYSAMTELIHDLGLDGYVIQAGYRNDPDAMLCAGDIYACTSRSEALSIAILEAMYAKLPPVVTEVGGNTDIVPPDGDCGLTVKFGDTTALAAALERLAADRHLREAMGERARQRVTEVFSEERMITETMGLYGSPVSKRP